MNMLAKKGVTMFIVSRDPNVVKGFNAFIDLNVKPVPKIGTLEKKVQAPDPGAALKS